MDWISFSIRNVLQTYLGRHFLYTERKKEECFLVSLPYYSEAAGLDTCIFARSA